MKINFYACPWSPSLRPEGSATGVQFSEGFIVCKIILDFYGQQDTELPFLGSSLSSLKCLPIDCLKIDRLFISDMPCSEASSVLVDTIVNMAHALNYSVVAEGVELEEEMKILKGFDCDTVQG